MPSTITQTTIANRALQLLGYQPIATINDNNRGARAMLRAYNSVLLEVLRGNFWSFAITRATLAASATKPAFGKANYFPLPGDFLMLAPPDQQTSYTFGLGNSLPNAGATDNDWQIENAGGTTAIASNDPSPLYIRYVSSNVTESMFDASFAEAFSAALAMNTCEELTQSNTKMQTLTATYKNAIEEARKRNAFENKPVGSPVDSWILVRM